MFPVVLDLTRLSVALIGRGSLTARRLSQLDAAGARHIAVFAENPDPELIEVAGPRLHHRLPGAEDLRAARVILITELPESQSRHLAEQARAAGALVNVEDNIPLCDFHTPSLVRHGDLLITVSTGGTSPGLARRLRKHLERLFGPEWGERLKRLAEARRGWRSEGADMAEVARRTDAMIDREGWLP